MRAAREALGRLRAAPLSDYAYYPLIAALTLVVFFWRPALEMPRMGIDPSWCLAMNHIVVSKVALGSDTTFTFGPLSRLYTSQYHPELFASHCVAAAVLSLIYMLLLQKLVASATQRRWKQLLLLLPLMLLCTLPDVFWYALPPLGLLAVLNGRDRGGSFLEACFWLGLTLLALMKASFFIAAGFIWAAELLAAGLARQRRWALLAFPTSFLLLWLAHGESLLALPSFGLETLAIASGYGEAMGRSLLSSWLLLGFAVSYAAASLALFHVLRRRDAGVWRFMSLVSYAFLGWGLFKGTLISGYVETMVGALLVSIACVVISCWTELQSRLGRWAAALSLVAGLTTAQLMSSLYHQQHLPDFLYAQSIRVVALVKRNAAELRAAGRPEEYEAGLAKIRRKYPLPLFEGSVDLYRTHLAVAVAHDLDWHPRPVFQSYAAYTRALAERNRQHLVGPGAPDNIVLELSTINGRFPTLDDGPSLPEILSRYQLTGMTKQQLGLFAKRSAPNPYRLVPAHTASTAIDGVLEVPGDKHKLLWVWLELDKTWAGRIGATLYRAPIVDMEVHFADGRRKRYNIVPSMSEAGFLLSPLVDTVGELASLNDDQGEPAPAATTVVAIELNVEPHLAWMYGKEVKARFAELQFERVDHAPGLFADDLAGAAKPSPPVVKKKKRRKRR